MRLSSPRELWIGAHLPCIAMEAWAGAAHSQLLVVVEAQAGTPRVVAASEPARRTGVRSGMTLAAALALAPQLQVRPRELAREQVLLEQLAARAQRFTPRVSLEPPDGLLLEVQGSLHLFGGATKLRHAFMAECDAAGAQPVLALAPTPLAALAGARSGRSFLIADSAQLAGQLSPLPLAVLRWPQEVLDRLGRMDVHTVGQALRLPRAGFAKRFGKEQLASLDRLMGRSADLRGHFQRRERFRMRQELLYEIEHHGALLDVFQPMLRSLEKFLQARQCGVTEIECRLRHRHVPVTRCMLRLAAPEADSQRLAALLGERLAALALPEPVRGCELRSGVLVPRMLSPESLWQPGEHGGRVGVEAAALIERLRARLGAEAVHGLQLFPAQRPEASWRMVEPGAPGVWMSVHLSKPKALPWAAFHRPMWLLPEPRLLSEVDGLPRRRGPLRLLSEPERIETRWWEGRDIARDYYVAVDVRGVRLWIFRERGGPHRWFLHGIFG